ncbi:ParD-like family protein [Arsukibacterium sp.]|uniref:ParD-like family protein n=1 Tax=Arsukibacterium sp. TaxID=1977258 RepID=UPI00299D88FB|nr:ParD-like family protein [Arsukibacterium sp.]MDX1539246.1 ParD-like family protein [Arsukibacterium sp.]
MGIVKIADELHEEIRKASGAMSRSINAQAEFWLKMGMLAELHPTHNYQQLLQMVMQQADVKAAGVKAAAVQELTGAADERRSA